MELAKLMLNWPEFDVVCRITLEKVVPRLLLPLQSDGRILKPCLLHGDCWDGEYVWFSQLLRFLLTGAGNTALDTKTGKAFVFDVCSFYGHNEYDTGNWRAPRHCLSNEDYIKEYKQRFPVSSPADDWDARNLLYSLTFNIGNTIYIPGSSQRQVIYDDMTALCNMFFPEDLKRELKGIRSVDSVDEQASTVATDTEGTEEDEDTSEVEEEEEEDGKYKGRNEIINVCHET